MGFLHWFQAGFAWFGGMLAGIAVLMWQGRAVAFKGRRKELGSGWGDADAGSGGSGGGGWVWRGADWVSAVGGWGLRDQDDAAVGCAYGAGCPGAPTRRMLVQPTPVYELLFSLVLAWWLWRRGKKHLPVSVVTGEYLVLSGIGRFLVEFVRINPRIYWGMSNAQVAALGSVVVGLVLIGVARRRMCSGRRS